MAQPLIATATGKTTLRKTLPFVVALAILCGVTAASGWWLANNEMNALVSRTQASEAAMNGWIEDVPLIIRDNTASPYGGTLPPNAWTEDMKARIRRQVSKSAGKYAATVLATGDDVRDVYVAPWNRSIRTAQRRYVAHNRVWLRYLTAVSKDYAAIGSMKAEIRGTFDSAKGGYRRAVPRLALHRLNGRVDEIFAD